MAQLAYFFYKNYQQQWNQDNLQLWLDPSKKHWDVQEQNVPNFYGYLADQALELCIM